MNKRQRRWRSTFGLLPQETVAVQITPLDKEQNVLSVKPLNIMNLPNLASQKVHRHIFLGGEMARPVFRPLLIHMMCLASDGLLPFDSLDEAAESLREVEADYERHAAGARALAAERFNSGKVLQRLIEDAVG